MSWEIKRDGAYPTSVRLVASLIRPPFLVEDLDDELKDIVDLTGPEIQSLMELDYPSGESIAIAEEFGEIKECAEGDSRTWAEYGAGNWIARGGRWVRLDAEKV